MEAGVDGVGKAEEPGWREWSQAEWSDGDKQVEERMEKLQDDRRKASKGFGEGGRRGRRHMGMNKFIVRKPE